MLSNAGPSRENDVMSFLKLALHPLLVGFVLDISNWQSEHHRFKFTVVVVWEEDIATRIDLEYASAIGINMIMIILIIIRGYDRHKKSYNKLQNW